MQHERAAWLELPTFIMAMNRSIFFLEPILFFNSPDLLRGKHVELMPPETELVTDLDVAMALENSQDPPENYKIWSDALSGAIAPFYSSPTGREGRILIDEEADCAWSSRGDFERDLNKKKMRRTITQSEEFWLTVAYDILETLKHVSLGRFVNGPDGVMLLEDVFRIYRAGLYPCGAKSDGSLAAFDVRVLQGP